MPAPRSGLPTALVLAGVKAEENMQGFPLAINLNANLAGNSKSGTFIAKAVYVKKGRSVSIVRTTVTTEDGKLIADVTTSHVPSR
jgi:1,4-dihydroxy-2-naphthoyl-CoA hydrolase